ncbi:MAG: endonuclease/exonuclease/phosphatase family protein, partial [Candidatus Spyradocola sp.]
TASARLISQYAQRISDLPIIVCGDFNMNPASAGYAEMTRHFTDANAVTDRDWRATYHAYGPKIDSDEHIDYCFTNAKITPKSVKILDEKVAEKYPSDHFGLHILLEI